MPHQLTSNEYLVVGYFRQLVYTYSLRCEDGTHFIGHTNPVAAVDLCGLDLYSGDRAGHVFAWNAETGLEKWHVVLSDVAEPVCFLRASDDLVFVGSSGPSDAVRVYHADTGRVAWAAEQQQSRHIAVPADGSAVFCADQSGHVHARDAWTGRVLWRSDMIAGTLAGLVVAEVPSIDGAGAVSASAASTPTASAGGRSPRVDATSPLHRAAQALSPTRRRRRTTYSWLVSVAGGTGSDAACSISAWDTTNGTPLWVLASAHDAPLSCMWAHRHVLFTASVDGSARAWDLRDDGECLWHTDCGVGTLRASSSRSLLSVASTQSPTPGRARDGRGSAFPSSPRAPPRVTDMASPHRSVGAGHRQPRDDGAARAPSRYHMRFAVLSVDHGDAGPPPPASHGSGGAGVFSTPRSARTPGGGGGASGGESAFFAFRGPNSAGGTPRRRVVETDGDAAGDKSGAASALASPSAASRGSRSGRKGAGRAMAMAGTSLLVALGSDRNGEAPRTATVLVIDAESGRVLRTYVGNAGSDTQLGGLAVVAGSVFASSPLSSAVIKWDLRTPRLRPAASGNATRHAVNMLACGDDRLFVNRRGAASFRAYGLGPARRGCCRTSNPRRTAKDDAADTAGWLAEGHSGAVRSIVVDADAGRVYSGSDDRTVRAWGISDGRCVWIGRGHTDIVWCVTTDTSLAIVFSGSNDCEVRAWTAGDGRPLWTAKQHTKMIGCMAALHGLAYSGSEDNCIIAWHGNSGRQAWRVDLTVDNIASNSTLRAGGRADAYDVWSLCVGDNVLLSGAGDNSVRCWTAATGTGRWCSYGHAGAVKCVAARGNVCFTASKDHTVRAWALHTGRPLWVSERSFVEVSSLSASPHALFVGTQVGVATLDARAFSAYGIEVQHLWARESWFVWKVQENIAAGDFVLQLMVIAVEFVQMGGFAFVASVPPSLDELQDLLTFFRSLKWPIAFSWQAVQTVALLFVLVSVAALYAQSHVRRTAATYPEKAAWKALHMSINLFLKMSSRVMILPVVGALLHAFRCTRLPSGVYTLDKDPSVQCWQGWHAAFAAAAFVALLMYVWLCTRLIRVGTQLSDIEVHGLRDMLPWTGWRKDVFHPLRRSPMSFAQTAHMQVLNVVKLLLLTLSVFFASHHLVVVTLTLFCGIVLVIVGWQYPPYFGGLGSPANQLRTAVDSGITWLYVCGLMAVMVPEADTLLLWLTAATMIVLPCVLCRSRQCRALCTRAHRGDRGAGTGAHSAPRAAVAAQRLEREGGSYGNAAAQETKRAPQGRLASKWQWAAGAARAQPNLAKFGATRRVGAARSLATASRFVRVASARRMGATQTRSTSARSLRELALDISPSGAPD